MENTIGKRIKEIREQKKLSTYSLAKMTGISQSTISKLENGKRSADVALLQPISKALNVEISDLLVETNNLLIGGRIKEQRELKGLGVDDISKNTGLNIQLLSDIENNIVKPSFETIEKIAESLNIPVSHLAATNYRDLANASPESPNIAKQIRKRQVDEGNMGKIILAAHMDNDKDYIDGLTSEEKDALEAYLAVYRQQQKQKKGD